MKTGEPVRIGSIPVRTWTIPGGLVFLKATQGMLFLCLGFLVWAGAGAVRLAAATIEGIWMVPHDVSKVPLLLIQGDLGKTLTIEYADAIQSGMWKALTNVVVTSIPHIFEDLNAAGVGKRFYRLAVTGDLLTHPDPARWAWIPPGTFTMGSSAEEQDRYDWEGPPTVVTLTKGYYMGKYEVTQREYVAVIGYNPSYFTEGRVVITTPPPLVLPPPLTGDLSRPVEWVSWNDAVMYCGKLTQQERAAGRLPAGWEYRLPTEAQWEYACRAGTTTRFYYGDDPSYSQLGEYAWFIGNSSNTTHPVGQKHPNAWGLYDMTGNVGEWCLDGRASYLGGTATDPQGSALGASRVIRGGSWYYYARLCRSAYRYYNFPDYWDGNIGFRVVLASSQL